MKNDFLQMYSNLKIHIEEANRVKVWPYWEEIVSVYPGNRLYLVTEGTATLQLKNKTILLEPGYLYFIPAFSVVGGKCDIFDHYFCHFTIGGSFSHITQFIDFNHKVSANETDSQLFKQIVQSFPSDTLQKVLQAEGSFKILFSRFFKQVNSINPQKLRFLNILNYIDKNYNKNISLIDLANEACLNEKYFCKLFKEYFELSPWQYVLQTRLNKASAMLFDNNFNIKVIALAVGFEDEFYFSRIFKKQFGMSPSEYKTQIKKMYEIYSHK